MLAMLGNVLLNLCQIIILIKTFREMALRIEKLETAEANRTTEDEKKKEEPEQPIMMQPQLMLTNSAYQPVIYIIY